MCLSLNTTLPNSWSLSSDPSELVMSSRLQPPKGDSHEKTGLTLITS